MTDDIKGRLWAEGRKRLAATEIERGNVAEARRILREVIEAGFAAPVIEIRDLTSHPRRHR